MAFASASVCMLREIAQGEDSRFHLPGPDRSPFGFRRRRQTSREGASGAPFGVAERRRAQRCARGQSRLPRARQSPLFSSWGNLKEVSKTGTIKAWRALKSRAIARGGREPCTICESGPPHPGASLHRKAEIECGADLRSRSLARTRCLCARSTWQHHTTCGRNMPKS